MVFATSNIGPVEVIFLLFLLALVLSFLPGLQQDRTATELPAVPPVRPAYPGRQTRMRILRLRFPVNWR